MAWQTVQYQWTSSCPALMHNGQTADPLNKWSKLRAQITAKRKKTDADHEELARIDFLGALYMEPSGPVWPSFLIDAVMVNAAKKSKEGQIAKSGVFCPAHASLEYDGPRDAGELWCDERFRHSAIVRVNTGRVVRVRPIFRDWSAVVTLNIETSVVNPARIDDWMHVAGTVIGVGDWRPQFGRFTAKRLNA